MIRISIGAAVAALALAAPAFAQSQAEIAARLNDEGKEQMYSSNYAQASAKFREAVARVPEPKYFFNLCTSLFQEGKFGEALTACAAVEKNNPSADLSGKATKMIGKIKAEADAQGLKVGPEGGGGLPDCGANPTAPGCSTVPPPPETCQTNPTLPECSAPVGPPPVVGRPPTGTGVFASVRPDNKYVWTLGGEFYGGGGKIGAQFDDGSGDQIYGTAMAGFRLKGDFLFNPSQRIGSQAWVSYSSFTAGEEQAADAGATLAVVDIGLGVYKHLCPPNTERLCLTPLIGASLALYSPEFDQFEGEKQFNYAALGGRAEIGLQYAFGSRMEHVLSVTLGANLYTAAFSGDEDEFGDPALISIEEAGLDKGGVVGYLGIGYTHRFSTPLGSSPFVTLE